MASPPHVHSPSAMSPQHASPSAHTSTKKRSSPLDMTAPPTKRRKGSIISQASGASHPLRQTSFPPEASASPYPRSPSVDAASHVSGSVASGPAGTGQAGRRRRGGRTKLSRGGGGGGDGEFGLGAGAGAREKTPSLAGGRAPTVASGAGGAGAGDRDKELEEEEDDEKAEMALEDVVARTQEQKQEEIRLRAMLVEAFDGEQYNRYELWRAAKLSDAVVKRSVPQMVATAVKAVAKLFAGEIIEAARNVQDEWILAGEKQSDLPSPPPSTTTTSNADKNETNDAEVGAPISVSSEEQQQEREPVAEGHVDGNGDKGEESREGRGEAGAETAQEGERNGDEDRTIHVAPKTEDGGTRKREENEKNEDENEREGEDGGSGRREEKKGEEPADLRRGPLRPDHLREAWRRYKMCGESQGVGVQQLWQTQQGTGVGRFSTRTRTRLFR